MEQADYKKLYEEARERAKMWQRRELAGTPKEMAEYIFPDLIKPKHEEIAETVEAYFKAQKQKGIISCFSIPLDTIIDWCEKQKETNHKCYSYDDILRAYSEGQKNPVFVPTDEQMDALNEASTSWMNEEMENSYLLTSLFNGLMLLKRGK